ncbi:MAG: hypothetical protein DSZ05_08860 [Sulfurospirillum sp.]|nr:MAG: hypothetical protein DSZ05_08860 [Sulfurospirillum sp.]
MLHLLEIFIICLGLVLLTGLITGYLFTIFSSKEAYSETIDDLKEHIRHNQEQTDALENEIITLQEKTHSEQQEADLLKRKSHEMEDTLDTHRKTLHTVQTAVQKVQEEHSSLASILRMQSERRDQLKREIGFDTASSLSQKIDEQQKVIQKIETEIEQESTVLNDTLSRHEKILAQKEELQTERDKLHEKFVTLQKEIEAAEAKTETFEEELKSKISSLSDQSNVWLARIKHYKEQLLQLKTSHSK